jgi:hypothetical protein
MAQAVHHGQDGDRAGDGVQRIHQPVDHGARQDGAGGVVDQDEAGAITLHRL